MELLRPILELGVVIPGMLLAYFPAKSSLKQPLSKLILWLVPLLALLCAAGGVVCYARRMPTAPMIITTQQRKRRTIRTEWKLRSIADFAESIHCTKKLSKERLLYG